MKKSLLAIFTSVFLVSILLLCTDKKAGGDSKLDPSQLGDLSETKNEDEAFYPFPGTETTYIVNHGKGWWYVPYTGAKLEAALVAFEKKHPGFVRDGRLQEVAMRSRYDSPLPLDKYEYDMSKGTFVLYYRN